MEYDRREFIKKSGLYLLLLLAPFVYFLTGDLRAPTQDVEKYKEFMGIDDDDGEQSLEQL